ncbi:MAG: hypothetical protein JW742_02170 [Candidatus Aminicenantes bacterium]|nr:hypothetical protein [Candidatus Aminicenantes bacterium]
MVIRKILGTLVIVLIGLPTLFGIIWAVGLVEATVSPEFLTDLPREIIAEIPDRADAIFEAAQRDAEIGDPDTRAWLQAAAKTGIAPRDLMDRTGLLEWMRGELADSLRLAGGMLRGDEPLRRVDIDLRPLKRALLHPETDRFLAETIKNLPPCDEAGLMAWQKLAAAGGRGRDLPACVPDPEIAREVVLSARDRAVARMDDEIPFLEDAREIDLPFFQRGISGPVTTLSYGLFLIPALFIFLGAVIAASSRAGILRWSGYSVMAGSIPVLVMAWLIKRSSLWALAGGPFGWRRSWSSELENYLLIKMSWIPIRIVDQLFSPVMYTAAVIAVIGVVLVALSYSMKQTPAAASAR